MHSLNVAHRTFAFDFPNKLKIAGWPDMRAHYDTVFRNSPRLNEGGFLEQSSLLP